MKKIILIITLLAVGLNSFSQDYDSYLKSFENGKELFKMERYGLAMQALKPLTSSFNDNPFIKQANFYYGVSAFKEGQISVAQGSFNYLKSNFPGWDQMDEVNIWLGKCALAVNNFEAAIVAFDELKKDDSKEFATSLLLSELEKLNSIDQVKELYKNHPDNKSIAIKMANEISALPLLEQDKDLLFEIVNKYGLEDEKYRIIDITESEMKKSYSIAVLLPFMVKDLETNRGNIRNEFVIDLYQGFLLGNEELKTMGIKLEISAYDTEKSDAKVTKILNKPELQHFDLIYGPLYPGPVKLTNQFSFDYKINMFNPLSTNSLVIGNNPYSFLYMPAYETQGKFCANIVYENAPKKNGIVFYSEDEKDSLMAFNFIKEMHSRGDSSIAIYKIKDSNSKKIIQILTDGTEVEVASNDQNKITKMNLFRIPKDSIGFIFVASENPTLAASTITALETRPDTILLIGMEKWLSSQIISYEALERLNTYLIAPIFIDKGKSQYKYFENAYKEKYKALPSINACLGYETSILLGRLLQKYGNHFQNSLGVDSNKGELFNKYQLNHKNDNQYIPVIHFQDAELKLVNFR